MRSRTCGLGMVALLLAGCSRAPAPEAAPAQPAALPDLPVYQIAGGPGSPDSLLRRVPARGRDPFAGIDPSRRVTLTSNNANARTLLLWLAEQAGISLVVSPDVRARVSVTFRDAPVAEAIRAVLAEARLSVLLGSELAPWPPVVFYQLPVNLETASAETIAVRFGVSLEMARWIVEARGKP